jgi:uncharacterized membrane protein
MTPMTIKRDILRELLGIIACLLVVYVANTGRFIGKFISGFLPCSDAPGTSLPCYGSYDIIVMVLALVICAILVVRLGLTIYKIFGAA